MRTRLVCWGLGGAILLAASGGAAARTWRHSPRPPAPVRSGSVADGPRDPALEGLIARLRASAVDRVVAKR